MHQEHVPSWQTSIRRATKIKIFKQHSGAAEMILYICSGKETTSVSVGQTWTKRPRDLFSEVAMGGHTPDLKANYFTAQVDTAMVVIYTLTDTNMKHQCWEVYAASGTLSHGPQWLNARKIYWTGIQKHKRL
jgi:hypothetical protein